MSSLAKAIETGEFIVTAECPSPRGASVDRIKACAAILGDKVHAVYAPENEDGARLSSLAACVHLTTASVEPMLALLTRDLNRIALQSAILGAASLGVRNMLCLAGKHQALTTSGSARGVFDVDATQLLQIASAMCREGKLADGQTLEAPVELVLGTDTNPFAEPVELQVLVLQKAVAAGADFVITQPLDGSGSIGSRTPKRFEQWMEAVRERGLHTQTSILASVASTDTNQGVETVAALREVEGVRGVHLRTGDDFELAVSILESAGLSRS